MKHRVISFILAVAAFAIPFRAFSKEPVSNAQFAGYFKVTQSTIAWEPYNSCDVSFGGKFRGSDYLGIGAGSLWLSRTVRGENREPLGKKDVFYYPLYLDYIHYFCNPGKRTSFFVGAEAGGAVGTDDTRIQKKHCHVDLKCGYDFSFNDDLGAFLEVDILAGYAYGLGITAGFRF